MLRHLQRIALIAISAGVWRLQHEASKLAKLLQRQDSCGLQMRLQELQPEGPGQVLHLSCLVLTPIMRVVHTITSLASNPEHLFLNWYLALSKHARLHPSSASLRHLKWTVLLAMATGFIFPAGTRAAELH